MTTNNKARTLAFQKSERNVFFHILTACNLSCRHCYINKEQHGGNTLPIQTIEDWLTLFYDAHKKSNVIFLGGEPTLHPDLPMAVQKANALGYSSVTIDTNGYLHNDILQRVDPAEAVLSFSLDGPTPEVNDPLRGEGVFKTCLTNLGRAVSAGFEVSVIYTVSALNYKHLHRMPALLREYGVKHFFIQIVGLRGNSVKNVTDESTGSMQISMEQWLDTVPDVAEKASKLGLHVIYPKVFLEENGPFECAGRIENNFFIFPNGRVYLCPLCEDFPVHTFTIEEGELIRNTGLTEERFFSLDIAEGCVMNKLLQPGCIEYLPDGSPVRRISCCLLKQEV